IHPIKYVINGGTKRQTNLRWVMFLEWFFPDVYLKSMYDISVERLIRKAIRLIFFDVYHLIAPYYVEIPDKRAINWLNELQRQGIWVCLLSNNRQKRVEKFNAPLGAIAIHRAGKPGIRKLRKILEQMGVKKEEAALVGDQI